MNVYLKAALITVALATAGALFILLVALRPEIALPVLGVAFALGIIYVAVLESLVRERKEREP